MSLPAPFASWLQSALAARLARIGGGGLLGLAILAWVADHAGEPRGSAVIHVTEAHVTVEVGPIRYQFVERPRRPIDCDLPAGEHKLIMTRDGRVLFEETFRIKRGQNVVLTAWDVTETGRNRAGKP